MQSTLMTIITDCSEKDLFKYISKCTVNWAKVQLRLCAQTASGFIQSERLCSLNLGFIYVS